MKIKVLFDKLALDEKLQAGWGVSFLINDKVLFDTGENGEWLIHNMHVLGVDFKKIESVVISHDHHDHTGGLWDILDKKNNIRVYSCPGFGKEFKAKVKEKGSGLVEADKFTAITDGIFITGEIPGAYNGKYMPEQAIALKTENGITIITGCAHPGIIKIVEKVKSKFPDDRIHMVLGGFHLKNADKRAIEIVAEKLEKIGVIKAGPTHCSGGMAEGIFKGLYGEDFVCVRIGQDIDV